MIIILMSSHTLSVYDLLLGKRSWSTVAETEAEERGGGRGGGGGGKERKISLHSPHLPPFRPINQPFRFSPSYSLILRLALAAIVRDYLQSTLCIKRFHSRGQLCKLIGTKGSVISRWSMIVSVIVVLKRTNVDSDWHSDTLCGSHLQSQRELYQVSRWHETLAIDLIGQLSRDVIGRLSVKPWCYWLWRLLNVIGAFQTVFMSQLNSRFLLVRSSVIQSLCRKCSHKKNIWTPTRFVWNTNMATVSLCYRKTNMAAVTSCENAL